MNRRLGLLSVAATVVVLAISLLAMGQNAGASLPGCMWGYIDGRETSLKNVTFGNGIFLAADGNGNLLFSGDGVSWRAGPGIGAGLVGLGFGNDHYVASGSCGGMLVSKDGQRWRRVRLNGTSTASKAHFDGEHILVTRGKEVRRSKNGRSWTVSQISDEKGVLALARGNGLYVGVGLYGRVFTSTDWTNWSREESAGRWNGTFDAAIHAGDRFVAVGRSGVIITSTDGKHWVNRESGTESDLLNIAYGNGRFVAVGTDHTVLTSADGVTWERTWELTWQPMYDDWFVLWDVAYGNGRFVVVGSERTVLISEDGTDWQVIKVPLDLEE